MLTGTIKINKQRITGIEVVTACGWLLGIATGIPLEEIVP